MSSPILSLKLVIDSKSNNVLFAEAGKEFVDFLFYLMALPVGAVIHLLDNKDMVGCLTNLYESIEKLGETYMLTTQSKDFLLKPKSLVAPDSAYQYILTPGYSMRPVFYCNRPCVCVSEVYGASCACAGKGSALYSGVVMIVAGNGGCKVSSSYGEGFVKGAVTYMVLNDLTVQPMSSISRITNLLNKLNVIEVGCIQEKVVNFGSAETLNLLDASFRSETVLTDIFLKNL